MLLYTYLSATQSAYIGKEGTTFHKKSYKALGNELASLLFDPLSFYKTVNMLAFTLLAAWATTGFAYSNKQSVAYYNPNANGTYHHTATSRWVSLIRQQEDRC